MRDSSSILQRLRRLGLTEDESAILLTLLGGPRAQLGISRETGIARSNVYRIVDGLAAKGLVHELVTDEGKLAAAKPEALELLAVEQETLAAARRAQVDELLPLLASFGSQEDDFSIRTYHGLAGVKQMLWNELSAKGEVLVFSGASIEVATGRRWAEKYRVEVVRRGLKLRGIENVGVSTHARNEAYERHYRARVVPVSVLRIQSEISIHDDTISVYNSLAHETRLGTEIANPFLASFMRQVFERYWSLAAEPDR